MGSTSVMKYTELRVWISEMDERKSFREEIKKGACHWKRTVFCAAKWRNENQKPEKRTTTRLAGAV